MIRSTVWIGFGVLALLLTPSGALASNHDDDVLGAIAYAPDPYAAITERGRAEYTIVIMDNRVTQSAVGGNVPVACRAEANTTESTRWSFTQPGGVVLRTAGDVFETSLMITAGLRPEPDFFVLDVTCVAGGQLSGQVVGAFQVSAEVMEYTSMGLQPFGAPPKVGPDEPFFYQMRLINNGNRPKVFFGEVEAPPGWQVVYPHQINVPPKESRIIEITGISPAKSKWMGTETSLFRVAFWPEGEPESRQERSFVASHTGVYIHPATVPLIILGALALVVFGFLVAYSRRTLEEQVLGKPVPPWRIPVEREYLKHLSEQDPDEFYIVRYHLMVEEHHSALLWYKHFKKATRKGRKMERRHLNATKKVKGRVHRVRLRQERLENRVARRLRILPVRRRNRLASLDRRLLAAQWREQRALLKLHRKSVARIHKIHAARVKKMEKSASAAYAKERKRAEKENRKRIRQGDDPLPLPEPPSLAVTEPEFPTVVEVPLQAIGDSRFAQRAERTSRGFNRRIAKRSNTAKRRMRRKGTKREKKATRLKSRIPEMPASGVYDEDKFLDENEVVVEDDRSFMQRALNIPTLEDQNRLRGRRLVYRVRMKQAADANDLDRVAELKEAWEKEKIQILGRKTGRGSPHGDARGGSDSETPTEQATAREERHDDPGAEDVASGQPAAGGPAFLERLRPKRKIGKRTSRRS